MAMLLLLLAGMLDDERDVPNSLKQLLERKNIIATGRNVHVDTARLAKLGVNVKQWEELRVDWHWPPRRSSFLFS